MDIFDLSGTGSSRGLAISMGHGLEDNERRYLNPDNGEPSSDARLMTASKWAGLKISSGRVPGSRAPAYFEDACGPGFYLPGCTLCVSDRARNVLEPILGGQVEFLPIDIEGAPSVYWVFYVTQYYDCLDMQLSRFRDAPTYASDKRRELREPVFEETERLHELYVFRVRGSADYVPFGLGDFATGKFFDLVHEKQLSGFTFIRVQGTARDAAAEAPVLVSKGPRFKPNWP